jgi:hypothetical protein
MDLEDRYKVKYMYLEDQFTSNDIYNFRNLVYNKSISQFLKPILNYYKHSVSVSDFFPKKIGDFYVLYSFDKKIKNISNKILNFRRNN